MGCCTSSRVSSVKAKSRSFPDYSEEFEGPVQDRSCTDVFFLILFSVFTLFLLVSAGVASNKGDPRRLIYGYDNYGNLCGVKNTPIPKANRSGVDYTGVRYLKVTHSCSPSCKTEKECQKQCPKDYEETTFRRCLPAKVTNSTLSIFQSTLPFFEEVGADISLCWKEILLLCFISIGLSVFLLIVFRFCASIIIWALLGLVTVACIAITIYLWITWHQKKSELAKNNYEGPNKDLKGKKVTYWMIAAIIATVLTVIYLLVVIFMRNKIKLVAALFEEAGKSVAAMPLILLQPVMTFISLAAACGFVLLGFICYQSSGEATVGDDGKVSFPLNTFFQVMRWISLFGFIWVTQFILACQHLVVAGAVAVWYFTRDKQKLHSPIWRSLTFLIRFHLGSVALGSFIISLMKAIRALFRLLQKHLDSNNLRCVIFWKIFQCCLACFESYLKFLTRNAYIMIAIYGESFCTSARKAFGSMMSNLMRVAAVDCIGDFILFVGKVGVTVAVAFIAIEIIKTVEGVHYLWIPVAISCVFAYLSCHCFLSIYEMTIDTLLLCFCVDCEMNDGITRPYFMNRSLMIFVEKNRKSAKLKKPMKNNHID